MKQKLMKKILVTTLSVFVFIASYCQYYYNDIVSSKAANTLYLNYQKNNIQQITAQSFEADNTPTEGFFYDRQIKNNGNLVITSTALEASGTTITYETYQNNLLMHSVDSSINSTSTVDYTYDNGNLAVIKTQTEDTSMNMLTTELHKWFYTAGVPDSMLRIKDNADTTVIHFKKDEKQNLTEEIWLKKNRIIEHYYYYYDNLNRITDIVRFDQRAKQMLPDFIFEYNANNTFSQMTEVPQGSSDYIIWAYIYDERGLKTKDILYDKHQQLLGTVTYTFN